MLAALLDLVLPLSCVGCGSAGAALCGACVAPELHAVTRGGLAVVAATRYDGGVRSALIAYKERGRRDLAGPLGALLALAVQALGCDDPVLVPVPSAPAARRARGGDHVARLGRSAGRCTAALRLVRDVRDSAGLDTAARSANLAGAMQAVRPRRPHRPAVIIDDITTTGVTLAEAARALDAAGWSIAGAAVVAATPRRRPARLEPTAFTPLIHLARPRGPG